MNLPHEMSGWGNFQQRGAQLIMSWILQLGREVE